MSKFKSRCFSKKNLRSCSFGVIISTRHSLLCFMGGCASVITHLGYVFFFCHFANLLIYRISFRYFP